MYDGFRWSLIAGRLPGRTDNEVKNYWNSHLRRKLINMGIDPNNHRLSQNLPRPQTQKVSGSLTSSGTKNQACQPCQPVKTQQDNDQISDAGSCLEDDTCTLPDLNLDLTISIPSPSLTVVENRQQPVDSDLPMELESAPSPTLLLFR